MLLELRKVLPQHSFHYVADSAWCPYGSKSPEQIRQRTHAVAQQLMDRGATTIIVACNSATIHAIASLRATYPEIDFIGLEPALKPASMLTQNGKIAVLATSATLAGDKFHKLIAEWITPAGHTLHTQDCPKFVELVERGITQGAEVDAAIAEYLEPIIQQSPDTLVLGCTHYPFLSESIRAYVPDHISILDTGAAVAQHTANKLAANKTQGAQKTQGAHTTVHSTGDITLHKTLIPKLCLPQKLSVQSITI